MGLTAVTAVQVPAAMPTIVPVLLRQTDGTPIPPVQLPDGTMVPVRIPSLLVIPGNVGYLKQFFSAQLYVTNGTPNGVNLVVHDVAATINLPPGPRCHSKALRSAQLQTCRMGCARSRQEAAQFTYTCAGTATTASGYFRDRATVISA